MYFVEYWMLERTNCCENVGLSAAAISRAAPAAREATRSAHSPAEFVGDGPAAETTHHAADGEY